MAHATLDAGPARVAGATAPPAARRCIVRRILDADPDRRSAILDRLHADARQTGWSDHALARALGDMGHRVGWASLNNHRRRVCVCTTFEHDDSYEAQ